MTEEGNSVFWLTFMAISILRTGDVPETGTHQHTFIILQLLFHKHERTENQEDRRHASTLVRKQHEAAYMTPQPRPRRMQI